MHLRFGGARADRAPGDQVGGVLRRDGVEELRRARQAHLGQFPQQAARDAQAFVDPEAAVEARIVDQALPADGGARLLEIDAHQDQQVVRMAVALGLEAARVLQRRIEVVDRARADHDQQAVVGAVQDAVDRRARLVGGRRSRLGGRIFAQDMARRREFLDLADADVVDDVLHDGGLMRKMRDFTALQQPSRCRRPSCRRCAASAGRRRPARSGLPCRRCRRPDRAPGRCRSSRRASARPGRCRSASRRAPAA